jgi:hypothetical protein
MHVCTFVQYGIYCAQHNMEPYTTNTWHKLKHIRYILKRVGPHYSLTYKRVLLPTFGSKGGDTLDCGGEGVGNPLPTKGQALLLCILYEESVRARLKKTVHVFKPRITSPCLL